MHTKYEQESVEIHFFLPMNSERCKYILNTFDLYQTTDADKGKYRIFRETQIILKVTFFCLFFFECSGAFRELVRSHHFVYFSNVYSNSSNPQSSNSFFHVFIIEVATGFASIVLPFLCFPFFPFLHFPDTFAFVAKINSGVFNSNLR